MPALHPALERGGPTPLLEAPVGQIRVAAASDDAKTGKLGVDFQAPQTGIVVFRTRKPGGVFKSHPVAVKAGTRYPISTTP